MLQLTSKLRHGGKAPGPGRRTSGSGRAPNVLVRIWSNNGGNNTNGGLSRYLVEAEDRVGHELATVAKAVEALGAAAAANADAARLSGPGTGAFGAGVTDRMYNRALVSINAWNDAAIMATDYAAWLPGKMRPEFLKGLRQVMQEAADALIDSSTAAPEFRDRLDTHRYGMNVVGSLASAAASDEDAATRLKLAVASHAKAVANAIEATVSDEMGQGGTVGDGGGWKSRHISRLQFTQSDTLHPSVALSHNVNLEVARFIQVFDISELAHQLALQREPVRVQEKERQVMLSEYTGPGSDV